MMHPLCTYSAVFHLRLRPVYLQKPNDTKGTSIFCPYTPSYSPSCALEYAFNPAAAVLLRFARQSFTPLLQRLGDRTVARQLGNWNALVDRRGGRLVVIRHRVHHLVAE